MQPSYRPQQPMTPQQRPPHGLAPSTRRGGPAPGIHLAPGMPQQHAPMQMPYMQQQQPSSMPMQQPLHPHQATPQHFFPQQPPQPQQPQQHQQHHQPQQAQPQHFPMASSNFLVAGAPMHHQGAPMMAAAPMPQALPPHINAGGVHPMQHHHAAMMPQHPQQPPQLHHQQQQQQQQQQQHQQQQQLAVQHQQHQQQVLQQQAQNQALEATKRNSRKPTDKTIVDGVEDVIVGDGVQQYRALREFERRLDATMTRKRLDIMDSVQRPAQKRFKTLRIWVSNTVENQLWQTNGEGRTEADTFDFSTTREATYTVKIEGRLLDDEDDDDDDDNNNNDKKDDSDDKKKDAGEAAADGGDAMDTDDKAEAAGKKAEAKSEKLPRHRFTHFFRAMSVDFNAKKEGQVPGQGQAQDPTAAAGVPKPVEWRRSGGGGGGGGSGAQAAAAAGDLDQLTFKRPGDTNTHILINLYRLEEPERCELDAALADIVDMREATRAEAVMGLFEYIRLQNLQEDEEKRNFRCDDLLRKLINNDIGYIPLLHEYVNAHIRPLPPVQLPYLIRVDEAFHRPDGAATAAGYVPPATIYDVQVAVNDPLREQLLPFVQNAQYMTSLREVAQMDDQLAVLVQAIGMSKSKHEFLTGMARDPARFVRQWLSSQKRDLDVIMGESERGAAGSGGSDLLEGSGADAWRRGGKSSIWASQNARESVNLLLAKQPLIPRGA